MYADRSHPVVDSPGLCIRLFGSFQATLNGAPLSRLYRREGARLLAFLALRAATDVEYRTIAEHLFPYELQQAGASAFTCGAYPSVRQAIFALRQTLGEEAHRLVSVGKGIVRLDPRGAYIDTLAFERLARGDVDERQQALSLYRGALLAEWPDPWIEADRARYERNYRQLRTARYAASLAAPLAVATSAAIPTAALSGAKVAVATMPQVRCAPQPVASSEDDAGGALAPDSPLYLERSVDSDFLQALMERRSVALLKGPRQVGKSSLLARQLRQARAHGARVALTDLQMLQAEEMRSPDALALALARLLHRQLRLDAPPESLWNTAWGANLNLEIYLEDVVLKAPNDHIIWAIDEADRLFYSPCGNDLFGVFRSWHNRRALEPDGVWSRLTLVIAYATEAYLFISDLNQSPFNIGTRLVLQDFTQAQVAALNDRYGRPLGAEEELTRFHSLLGGHPHLTRCGLAAIARGSLSLSQLESRADCEENGPFGEHLRRLRVALSQDERMRVAVRALLTGTSTQETMPQEIFTRLRSGGVLVGDYPAEARFRCTLYATYLRHLLVIA
jgi:hypothetical protein